MHKRTSVLVAAIVLHGCSEGVAPRQGANDAAAENRKPVDRPAAGGRWDLQGSGEGVALTYTAADGSAEIRLACPAGAARLNVNVAAFRPVGSEERLSFGGGGDAHALVADPRGDAQRGGVSAAGAVPANLASLVSGPISASFGAQSSGPHPAPPRSAAAEFAAACAGQTGEATPPKPPTQATPAAPGACLTQDGKPVPAIRLRAVGTEPFWAAQIDGRCVTYSHPEDQQGTRVWTRFSGTASNGNWTGALKDSPFVLRTRPVPGCSDGMSDNRYPIAVTLTVGGEQRSGCAHPL
jgi:uncharacterized membrane protein